MSCHEQTKTTQIESIEYDHSEKSKFEFKFTVQQSEQQKIANNQNTGKMAYSTNFSKIPSPGFSRKQLNPIYEKTKLLRTVLERQVTRKPEHPQKPCSINVAGNSRAPNSQQMVQRQLNFSNMDESKAYSTREHSDPSLGILRPEEMDLGSFENSGRTNSSNFSDGILTDSQMICNTFDPSCNKIDTDYLLNRLQDQIILHNTLLDASETFSKSPSIENLVKQCMQGTDALNALKQRVMRYKNAKRSAKKSLTNVVLLQAIPNIIRNTINCAEDLQKLSQEIMHVSSSLDENLLNRSSLTSKTIKDTTNRLKEIEQMWQHMPAPDEEEGSSLGLLHESKMHDDSSHFLSDVSTSLGSVFDRLNDSLEEVLQTPNTHSLNKLKEHLKNCQMLLSDITRNHSLLAEESMPSFAESGEALEVPLLRVVFEELDKSCNSEIEAFLSIWKRPENERFLEISKHTIDDLSNLRHETNSMLRQTIASNHHKQTSARRQHLINRLNVLRDTDAPVRKPTYTSIIMKDYIDEDDLNAEKERFSRIESTKRTVQFTDRSNRSVNPVKIRAQQSGERKNGVETRLETVLQEMNDFQQNYLTSYNQPGKDTAIIEEKIDALMAMISELVNTLRLH